MTDRLILWLREEAMDSMPFLHANQVFNIIFFEDLTFSEVRAILDELLDLNAFNIEVQESQGAYRLDVGNQSFAVWVSQMDVIIQRQ